MWRKRLARHRSSAMSVRAFCRREGLAETAFYFWRREIALRDAESASQQQRRPGFVQLLPGGSAAGVAGPGTLAPAPPVAATVPAAAEVCSAAIELCLGGNRRLLIRDGFDAALLARVVAALEGMSC